MTEDHVLTESELDEALTRLPGCGFRETMAFRSDDEDAKPDQLIADVPDYPTVTELIPTMLGDLKPLD